jgi:hypothetical protein
LGVSAKDGCTKTASPSTPAVNSNLLNVTVLSLFFAAKGGPSASKALERSRSHSPSRH